MAVGVFFLLMILGISVFAWLRETENPLCDVFGHKYWIGPSDAERVVLLNECVRCGHEPANPING